MPESPRWMESVGRTEEDATMLLDIEREFAIKIRRFPTPTPLRHQFGSSFALTLRPYNSTRARRRRHRPHRRQHLIYAQ